MRYLLLSLTFCSFFLTPIVVHSEEKAYQNIEFSSAKVFFKSLGEALSAELNTNEVKEALKVFQENKKTHKIIQSQFINKTVQKRYTALLDGIITENKGTINLPLRADLDDRPRQLVCYEHGKPAETKWEVIERKNGKTKVHFYPISGRTHQLRMHASHSLGLNTSIIGDDLYGKKSDRLYLHSDTIQFTHPTTKEKMKFYKKANF